MRREEPSSQALVLARVETEQQLLDTLAREETELQQWVRKVERETKAWDDELMTVQVALLASKTIFDELCATQKKAAAEERVCIAALKEADIEVLEEEKRLQKCQNYRRSEIKDQCFVRQLA